MILRRSIFAMIFASGMVAGCSDLTDTIREKYTGERHGQAVEGPRRAPVLNPAPKRPSAAPQVARTERRGPATPYDLYDEQGQERAPEAREEPRAVRPEAQIAPRAVNRKHFSGAVPYPYSTEVSVARSARDGVPPIPGEVVPVDMIVAPPPVLDLIEQENQVILPRGTSPRTDIGRVNEPLWAANESSYPSLYMVPKPPARFKEMRQEKQALQDMMSLRDGEQNKSKRLSEEPTELPAPTPPQVEDRPEAAGAFIILAAR